MFDWLSRKYFSAQIYALLALSPSKLFDRINSLWWYKDAHREWIDRQNIPTGASVLEVGCASGTLTGYIEQSVYEVCGVDFSEKMICLAKNKYPGVHFRVADAKNLPFDDNSFDAVVSASLINIVLDPHRTIAEMVRVCKCGGIISILVPRAGFTNQDFEQLSHSIGVSGFSLAALRIWNQKPPKMKARELVRMFSTEGLIVNEKIEYLQGMVFSVSVVNA